MSASRILVCLVIFLFLMAGCSQAADSCPPYMAGDLTKLNTFATDDQALFQSPLDEVTDSKARSSASFNTRGQAGKLIEYHAAEDYLQPPGTPVYTIADGEVSFSGPMGGYGWLVIVDHPQANLYSLYGHLSPSRWQIETGPVEKGQLLGYLGDDFENGGSEDNPLRPHLHLGIRAGQRSDYPGIGEWRWMAGWIKPCPSDTGWLQPSAVIEDQTIPPGGFTKPTGAFLETWGIEILFAAIYIIGGVCLLIYAQRRDKPLALVIYGILTLLAAIVFFNKGSKVSFVLVALAALFLVLGLIKLVGHYRARKDHA